MSHPLPARPRPASAFGFMAASCILLAAAVVPARAALFNDVALDLGLQDDARVFLNVANAYFAPPPTVAVDLLRRSPVPEDDFPVILFLARASKRPPEEILKQRLDYTSWSDIMARRNVSPAVLFAGIERDPGPPYGKAWGYWRKHPKGEKIRLRDRDVADLVKLQIASRSQRVSPYTLVAERNKGNTIEHYVAGKNRHKYPKSKSAKGHGNPHDRN
jgi:hypothetical protein